jgi:hypothetical protein
MKTLSHINTGTVRKLIIAIVTASAIAVAALVLFNSRAAQTPAADLNSDGKVDVLDLSVLLANWNKSGAGLKGDINADGSVNINDLSILLSSWGSVSPQPPAQPSNAKQADSFVDTIGTVTHLHYTGSPYKDNFEATKAKMLELGIRHYRDYPQNTASITSLGQAGIKLYAHVAHPKQGTWAQSFDTYWTNILKVAPYVTHIANINEPDINFPGGESNTEWPADVQDYQTRIWNGVRSTPALSHVKVAGPSMTFPNKYSIVLGDISDRADYGDSHPYPGGGIPEGPRVSSDMAYQQQYNVAGKPVIMSETGYSNAMNTTSTRKPVPESVSGIYMPRLFLYYYSLGIPHTFNYQFIDEYNVDLIDYERSFGLLHSDFTPKPAYTALKNLIALLKDPGASFNTSYLQYQLTGTNTKTKSLLLQKRDGTYWLAVWQTDSIWDTTNKVALNPAPVPVTLTLNSPASSIKRYAPNQGTQALASGSGTSYSFSSSAQLTLLQIIP